MTKKKDEYFLIIKSCRKKTSADYLKWLGWFKIRDSGARSGSRVCKCEARRTGSIFYHCSVLSSLMDPTGAEPGTTFPHSPQAGDTHAQSEETEWATCENVQQRWRVLVVTPTIHLPTVKNTPNCRSDRSMSPPKFLMSLHCCNAKENTVIFSVSVSHCIVKHMVLSVLKSLVIVGNMISE